LATGGILTGNELIERLIEAMNALACDWEDFVGESLANDVKQYMGWKPEPEEEDS
jgi:hypothetical protein